MATSTDPRRLHALPTIRLTASTNSYRGSSPITSAPQSEATISSQNVACATLTSYKAMIPSRDHNGTRCTGPYENWSLAGFERSSPDTFVVQTTTCARACRPTNSFWRNINGNACICHHLCVRSRHSGNVIRSANERPLVACRSTRPARHRRAGRPDTSIKFAISKNGSCVAKNRNGIRHLGVWPNCQRFVANSQSGDGFETLAVFSSLTGK